MESDTCVVLLSCQWFFQDFWDIFCLKKLFTSSSGFELALGNRVQATFPDRDPLCFRGVRH